MPKLSDITLEEVAARVAQENRWDMEISLRDLHEERDLLRNEIELLASARDNEQRRETKKTLKRRLDACRRELHSNQERISRLEELLGLEQSQEPPTGQGRLDVIIEETTETTVIFSPEDRERALIRKNIQTDKVLDLIANTAPTVAQQAQTPTVAQQADMYNLRTTAERKPTQKFTPSTYNNQQKTKKKKQSGSEKRRRRRKIRQTENEKEKI